MTILALINPQSLLGEEIKRELSRRKELWSEVRLLTTEEDQVGAVTDVAGDRDVSFGPRPLAQAGVQE